MRQSSAERVTQKPRASDAVFLLENGARMDQRTFHELYLKTPEDFKAELLGGVVHVASPVTTRHGGPHAKLVAWLIGYMAATLGTDVYDNTTNVLTEDSEPQPDAALLIQQNYGGRTRINRKGYILGAPELVAEVAHSTASVDLGVKKTQYENAGAQEYLVILVHEKQVRWFARRARGYEELALGRDGILRSEVFPGLWLRPDGFFAPLMSRHLTVARSGRASPEHAAFVAELAARRKKLKAAKNRKPPRRK
jgi:Uma2 family endonuclease